MNTTNNSSTGFPTFRFPKIDSNPILTYVSLQIPKALDPSQIVSYIYHPLKTNQRILIIDDPIYYKYIKNQALLTTTILDTNNLNDVILKEWDYDIDSFLNFYNNLSIINLKKALWINKNIHEKLFYNNNKKHNKLIQHRFQCITTHGQKRSEIRNQFQKNRFLLDYSI